MINQPTGAITPQWMLVQVDLAISEILVMMDYVFFRCKCYISHFEDFTLSPIAWCRLWTEIRELKWDDTLGKVVEVYPQNVPKFMVENKYHVWL